MTTFSSRKNWSTFLLVGLILATILAACGDSSSSTPQGASGAQSPAAGQTAGTGTGTSGTPVTLNFLLNASASEGGSPPDDWVVYKTLREKLGIDLKVSFITGPDKLGALAASNSLPDLFQLPSTQRDLFSKFAEQGLLAPVDSLLPMMPERTKARYSDPNLNKLDTFNNTLYGLQEPAVGTLYKRNGLFIRQDWLDKLGLKAPTNLDEFMTVAKAFTEKDPDGNGKNDTFGFGAYLDGAPALGNYFDVLFGAFGVPADWNYSDLANFGATYKVPDYQKAVSFIAQLNQSKVIDPDWPTMKVDDFRARWKQGKYGMFVEDFCALACQANYKAFDTVNPKGNLQLIAPPKGPDGKSAVGAFTAAGNNWLVSKRAMDAGKGPAIAKFLEWANSGEGYYLLGFGQKDINYKVDASNNIVLTGIDPKLAYNSKESQPILQLKGVAYNGNDQELTARYAPFQTSDGRPIAPLNIYKATFSSPYVDATPGQLIRPAANSADISRYTSENLVQFVLGQKQVNDANWKTFIDGLNGLNFTTYETAAKKTLQDAGFK